MASLATTTVSLVTLTSQEGEKFEVPRKVGCSSDLIKSMLNDDHEDDDPIPLPNVSSKVLSSIIAFLHKHSEDPMKEIAKPLTTKIEDVVQPWYANFADVDNDTLFDLIQAANYMDIKPLLNLMGAKIASIMKGKTPDEIRALFKIDSTDAAH